MLNKFPLWKNILLIVILIFGMLYAAPNLYGDDPAIQITGSSSSVKIDNALAEKTKQVLKQSQIDYKAFELGLNNILIRFYNTDTELRAASVLKSTLGGDYTVALNLAPATPRWLTLFGAQPLKLGLDLRGGINFLLDVDVQSVVTRRLEGMVKSISDQLRKSNIRYAAITQAKDNTVNILFRDETSRDNAFNTLQNDFPDLSWTKKQGDAGQWQISGKITPTFLENIRQYTIDQAITTLRNRVNELGISEAQVVQQGANRISVDLPGVQDSARAKQILGGTATLEFHLVDNNHDVQNVVNTGIAPPGTTLYRMEDGAPILLQSQVVLSGNSITSAIASFGDDGRPTVNISLGGGGESFFSRVTSENVGNRMAIVYVETKTINKVIDGKPTTIHQKKEKVISAPVIQSALGNNFQITGINDPMEARNLALLLRAGAMPTNMDIIEERNIGPSLGLENIRMGALSVEIAFILIAIFMALYYNVFGVIADIALLVNLVLLVAIMSVIGATLTLPGIAGIVLTVGMAVDGNVLIFERIREELRNGVSPQASIHAGFERAFGTIVDANVSTLIVAIILFGIGTGAIKGFAITLTIGLLTSMFTAVTFTRGLVNALYGGRPVKKLPLGIKVRGK